MVKSVALTDKEIEYAIEEYRELLEAIGRLGMRKEKKEWQKLGSKNWIRKEDENLCENFSKRGKE